MTAPDQQARDELLAIRCQLGERAAFDELIERWHGPLRTYIRRLLVDEERTREMVQDVWVRIIRGIPSLRDPARLRAWLFKITRHRLRTGIQSAMKPPSSWCWRMRPLPPVVRSP